MGVREHSRRVRFKSIRPQYGIATLLVLMTVSAALLSLRTSGRQEQRTRAIYDAQKMAVDDAIDEFTMALRSDGYDIENMSSNTWGSGEWIKTAAIAARQGGGAPLICYVEVQGFVSHDAGNKPTWRRVLPMKISHCNHELDGQFVAILSSKLDENDWRYATEVSRAAGAAPSRMDSMRSRLFGLP